MISELSISNFTTWWNSQIEELENHCWVQIVEEVIFPFPVLCDKTLNPYFHCFLAIRRRITKNMHENGKFYFKSLELAKWLHWPMLEESFHFRYPETPSPNHHNRAAWCYGWMKPKFCLGGPRKPLKKIRFQWERIASRTIIKYINKTNLKGGIQYNLYLSDT